MITIDIQFKYAEVNHKLRAYLRNNMSLSGNKQNMATDITEDFGDKSRWSLYFADFDEEHDVEVIMFRDADGNKTLEADYAIIWIKDGNGAIEDEVDVQCRVKM